jgi:hypothetical protein
MDNVREKERAGLCASCLHVRLLRSDRGAVFYQCRRADRDPDFPKYPRLPVLVCKGYEARPASEDAC